MNETLEIPIGTDAAKPTVGGWLLAITQTIQEDQQQIPSNEMTERERRFFMTICVLSAIVDRFSLTAPREVTSRVMAQPLVVNLTPRGQ